MCMEQCYGIEYPEEYSDPAWLGWVQGCADIPWRDS